MTDRCGNTAAKLQADLRQLGRFARPGLAGDNDNLMGADRIGDLLPFGADRQRIGKTDLGQLRPARRKPSPGALDIGL